MYKLIKKAIECYAGDNNNTYVIIDINNNECGMIEYHDNKIEYIKVYDDFKRKGIGKNIIFSLLDKNKYLYGDCLPRKESINFWKSINAEFEEDIEECLKKHICIPFSICK